MPKLKGHRALATVARDASIVAVLIDDHPQSVRHVFYRLTDPSLPGSVEKTEAGYRQVQQRVKWLRENEHIPYDWIADMTRAAHWNYGYGDGAQFLNSYLHLYRQDLWTNAAVQVEVWCEARSMVGVLNPVCREFCVPLFPSGGYASDSFLYQAAQQLVRNGADAVIYHVGDYDDDGLTIADTINRRIPELMRRITSTPPQFRFERLAVTEQQIRDLSLPEKPAKATRRRRVRLTVEAESIPAATIRRLLTDTLASHLDADLLERTEAIEQAQRASLSLSARLLKMQAQFGGNLMLHDDDGLLWMDDGSGVVAPLTQA